MSTIKYLMLVSSIILIVLSGISKAFMDLCKHETLLSWGSWWSEHKSHVNKWAKGTDGVRKKSNGEAWPTSSTLTVFLTDGWHGWQKLTYDPLTWGAVMFVLAMPIHWVWSCLIATIGHKIIFELFYRIIKSLK